MMRRVDVLLCGFKFPMPRHGTFSFLRGNLRMGWDGWTSACNQVCPRSVQCVGQRRRGDGRAWPVVKDLLSAFFSPSPPSPPPSRRYETLVGRFWILMHHAWKCNAINARFSLVCAWRATAEEKSLVLKSKRERERRQRKEDRMSPPDQTSFIIAGLWCTHRPVRGLIFNGQKRKLLLICCWNGQVATRHVSYLSGAEIRKASPLPSLLFRTFRCPNLIIIPPFSVPVRGGGGQYPLHKQICDPKKTGFPLFGNVKSACWTLNRERVVLHRLIDWLIDL